MSTTNNDIGKTLWVAAALPATNDATGFEALTWIEAKYHQTLPQLGISHATNPVSDLKTGFARVNKGEATGNSTEIAFRIDNGDRNDAGQAAVKAAAIDEDGFISVKIVDGTGVDKAPVAGDRVEYAQGIMHSYMPNQGTVTSHEGFTVTFQQNDQTVTGTEPV